MKIEDRLTEEERRDLIRAQMEDQGMKLGATRAQAHAVTEVYQSLAALGHLRYQIKTADKHLIGAVLVDWLSIDCDLAPDHLHYIANMLSQAADTKERDNAV